MTSVKLHYQNGNWRGPGKVASNLTKGLNKLGVTVNEPTIGEHDYHGCLQMVPVIDELFNTKNNVLYGPNLVVTPDEAQVLYGSDKHFVVPSQWCKDMYCQFDFVDEDRMHVWSVGIDTDKWTPSDKEPTQDCFIYFKNRSQEDLELVRKLCRKFGLSYSILQYGAYPEPSLKRDCENSKFVILLTGTESQGIGYMEILSTNTPCYVFNKSTWKSERGHVECSASSTPYFDSRCGEISNNVDLKHFDDFLTKIHSKAYSPRDYMLENHTLEKSAANYLKVLEAVNAR